MTLDWKSFGLRFHDEILAFSFSDWIRCNTLAFMFQKCVTALEKTWHTEHFFCAQCGQQFGEDGFHERDGKPYCRADYFDMFAPKCGGCNKPIMENYISALNTQWHPDCFVCKVSITISPLTGPSKQQQLRFVYSYAPTPGQVYTVYEFINTVSELLDYLSLTDDFNHTGMPNSRQRQILLCDGGEAGMPKMRRSRRGWIRMRMFLPPKWMPSPNFFYSYARHQWRGNECKHTHTDAIRVQHTYTHYTLSPSLGT